MNRFSIISLAAAAAVVVLATAPAHASGVGEGTPGYPHEFSSTSTTSRADVRAEARQAVAEGRVVAGEIGLKAEPTMASVRIERAAVRAEAAEAVRLGLVATGERSLVYTQPQLAALKAAADRAGSVVVAGQR